MEPDEIRAENIYPGTVTGELLQGTIATPPTFKRYIYKHAHVCSQMNELFVYRPATQGNVMYPIHPVCVETATELMQVRIEDDV